MLKTVAKIVGLCCLIVVGSVGIVIYQEHFSAQRQIHRLEEQKQQLQQIVERLSTERRVAEVLVTAQEQVDGQFQSTLLFVEYARDGSTLLPKVFTVQGKM